MTFEQVTEKQVTLKITKVAKDDSMDVDVEIPGIGTAHFWVQATGPVILKGKRGGIDLALADEPVIECYGLDVAEVIEL